MRIDWRHLMRHYLLVAVFCCAIAALTSAIWPVGYLKQLGYSLCIGTPTWAIIEAGRVVLRRPDDPGGWPSGARGLLLTIVGIALGFMLGSWLGDALLGIGPLVSMQDRRISIIVSVIAGVVATWFFYSRGERAELSARINAAERDVAEARLKLLSAQLEPHMLFNTLANLRALIASDPPRAIAMLDRLDSYLRVTLTGSMARTHPLAAEFDRLADYLALMQVRMGPRLRYRLNLPDDLRDTPVPPLLLQPLVENSVRHGLEPKVEGGEVAVQARREGQRLVIEVRDTGTGLSDADTTGRSGTGFGLTQVRKRLASVYGPAAALELAAAPGGGTQAILTLPAQHP